MSKMRRTVGSKGGHIINGAKEAAPSGRPDSCSPVCTTRRSADVGEALLGFRLGSGLGPRGKGENSCVLPFIEPRQQHDLAIGELERVMIDVKRALVDLAKDRNSVAGIGTKHEGGLILDLKLERLAQGVRVYQA
jgi:hypothetical protein